MIVTDLKNAAGRLPPGAAMAKALAFLRREDLLKLPDGEYELDGRRVFAVVQRYKTFKAAAPRFESHRKYIDVQYIAAGVEVIGWAPAGLMKVAEPYKAAADICFGLVGKREWTPVLLRAGRLAVLFPEDAHAPRLAARAPAAVLKIVVKVAVRPGRGRE